jgi:hypothetical protein
MDNLSAPLSLCFKLINTAASSSFTSSLEKPWVGKGKQENIQAIQKKAVKDLQFVLNRFLKWGDVSQATEYLNHLQTIKGIKLNKAEKKGLVRAITLDEYVCLNSFICNVSGDYRPIGATQSAQFDCHEVVRCIMDYLLIKDTVENGAGHQGLNNVIKSLIENKESEFFLNGYIADLFIIDRVILLSGSNRYKYLRCNRKYLSTQTLVEKSANAEDAKHYEFYKVA